MVESVNTNFKWCFFCPKCCFNPQRRSYYWGEERNCPTRNFFSCDCWRHWRHCRNQRRWRLLLPSGWSPWSFTQSENCCEKWNTARYDTKTTNGAREEILANFRKWVSKRQRPEHQTEEEFADDFFGIAGDVTVEAFVTRAAGRAKGEARLGSHIDLAVFTCFEDIRVVVIDTTHILRSSTESELLKTNSVIEACFPGECEKRRVVCAILSYNPSRHFDLGAVHTKERY